MGGFIMKGMVRTFGLVLLGLAVVAPVRADDQADARKIIDKAIEAQGGADTIAKNPASTTKLKGKFYGMGDGIDYTGTFAIQAPNRLHFTIDMTVMGKAVTVIQAIDGDKGWISINGMVVDFPKEALAEAHAGLHLHEVGYLVCLTGNDYKLSTVGEAKIDDRPAVGVHVERKDRRDINLFFDKETGLLLKTETRAKDPAAGDQEFTDERYYRDYKKVGPVMVPHKVEVNRDGKLFLDGETTELTMSEKLDEGLFAKP
jgi:hypothetical protein